MSLSKKIELLRDFATGVYLSEAQNPISPLHIVKCVYCILIHTGGGGGGLNQGEGWRGNGL